MSIVPTPGELPPGATSPLEPPIVRQEPVADRLTRDRSLVHGVAWNGVIKLLVQAATWGSTLIVARLLSPADYGVMGLATMFLGLIELVTEFGIGVAVATRKDLTESQTQQLNTVAVLLGACGTLIICAIAQPAGRFFHDSRLPLVLVVLSANFLLGSLRSVPWGLLQRELRFKRLAIYDGAQALALTALSLVLAILGFRYWTLVVASIMSAFITALVAVLRHPVAFKWPVRRDLSRLISFSGNIVGQRAAWYAYSNADFFVAGKLLGSGPLGNYSLASNLSHVTDKVTALVLQVTPSVLAKVRDDKAEMRRYVIRISEVMSLTVLPLMVGLALVAADFVRVILGPKWDAMVIPLQILSAYATVGVVTPLFAQVLNVSDGEGFAMRNNLLQLAVMPPVFAVGGYFWGINGIALGWVVAHPFLAFRLVRHTLHRIDLRVSTYLKEALMPSLASCLVMALAVLGVKFIWPQDHPTVVKLATEIVTGAATYLLMMLTFYRRRIISIQEFARSIARRNRTN